MVKKSVPVKKTAAKKAAVRKVKPTLGEVVMIYTKSSSHWYALIQAEIIEIEGIKFIRGTQVTGKVGHRMEGKRTLIPFDHVGSIVEFASEDDLWSEPQPKFVRPPEEERQSVSLTSHEQQQAQPQSHRGGNSYQQGPRHHKRHPRHRHGSHSQGNR